MKGLGNFPQIGNVMNLYFIDDILFYFLKLNKDVFTHIKWLLVAFEKKFVLKIKYENSEMYHLNLSTFESDDLASVLGCKVASLPLT